MKNKTELYREEIMILYGSEGLPVYNQLTTDRIMTSTCYKRPISERFAKCNAEGQELCPSPILHHECTTNNATTLQK